MPAFREASCFEYGEHVTARTKPDHDTLNGQLQRVSSTRGFGYQHLAHVLRLASLVNARRAETNLAPIPVQTLSEQIGYYRDLASLTGYVHTLMEGAEE